MDDLPAQPPAHRAPVDPLAPNPLPVGAASSTHPSPDNVADSDAPKEETPPSRRPGPRQDSANVKETLESILVAFILAFIFRCFVVEAFVIPTASMAPTLLGAHMRFRCPDCGYRFDANYSPAQNGDDLYIPSDSSLTYRAFCPNCGF